MCGETWPVELSLTTFEFGRAVSCFAAWIGSGVHYTHSILASFLGGLIKLKQALYFVSHRENRHTANASRGAIDGCGVAVIDSRFATTLMQSRSTAW